MDSALPEEVDCLPDHGDGSPESPDLDCQPLKAVSPRGSVLVDLIVESEKAFGERFRGYGSEADIAHEPIIEHPSCTVKG